MSRKKKKANVMVPQKPLGKDLYAFFLKSEWKELPYSQKNGFMVAYRAVGYDSYFYYNYRYINGSIDLVKWRLITDGKQGLLDKKSADRLYRSIMKLDEDTNNRRNSFRFYPIQRDEDSILFGPKTFVIKSHDYACRSKGHTIRDINAVAMVLDKANNVVDHRVAAAFCEECDMLYMTPHAFEQLKKSGIPLFRTEDTTKKRSTNHNIFSDFATESLLRQLGYTVSQVEGLTEGQRHGLLTLIIRSEIISRWEIAEHLEQLINLNGNSYSKDMGIAISKWENDLAFLDEYNNNFDNVVVDKILNRHYFENYSMPRKRRISVIL